MMRGNNSFPSSYQQRSISYKCQYVTDIRKSNVLYVKHSRKRNVGYNRFFSILARLNFKIAQLASTVWTIRSSQNNLPSYCVIKHICTHSYCNLLKILRICLYDNSKGYFACYWSVCFSDPIKTFFTWYANNKDSDEPAHRRILNTVFVIPSLHSKTPRNTISKSSRL